MDTKYGYGYGYKIWIQMDTKLLANRYVSFTVKKGGKITFATKKLFQSTVKFFLPEQ